MTKKISIITVSFNSEKTIERTLQSILTQTYRPLEYVLVDGSSKDGTVALIESYIPKFRAVGIEINFKSEPDYGISDAFNKGIDRSDGEIIGIINSDDQLTENILKRIADEFSSDIDVVCGNCLWIDEDRGLSYVRKSRLNLNKLKYEMVLMHPTCFVQKNAYFKWGKFNVDFKYVMDKELMSRFYRNGAHFRYIPQTIAIMHSGGASDANSDKVMEEGIIVAMQNGVPRWKATLHGYYKSHILKFITFMKSNKYLWKMVKKLLG